MTYFPSALWASSIVLIESLDRENDRSGEASDPGTTYDLAVKSALYPSGRCLFVRFPENDLPRTTRSTFLRISAMDASVFAPSDGMIRQRSSPIFPYRSMPLT